MRVLSLFDGMGGGRLALERAGIPVTRYYASEIDEHAVKVAKVNYPDIIHVGDVENVKAEQLPDIDLLIGGSPCQGFSNNGKMLNFKDPRSKLFFDYVRILKEVKPRYFFLENVKMKKAWADIITEYLGVEPVLIDSALVSAQKRRRYYWTNIPGITQPQDKGIVLDDIIEMGADCDKAYHIRPDYLEGSQATRHLIDDSVVWRIPEATKAGFIEVRNGDYVDLTLIKSKTRRGRAMLDKSNCLTATPGKYCRVVDGWFRLLTPLECERLQTVPEGYTDHVSQAQRYKMLGNGWTIDVIAHIFKNLIGKVPGPQDQKITIFDYAFKQHTEELK